MPQNNTDIAKLVDAAFERALQAHGIDASQIDGAMLKNEVLAEIARASVETDSARLGGYSKSEFDALRPTGAWQSRRSRKRRRPSALGRLRRSARMPSPRMPGCRSKSSAS